MPPSGPGLAHAGQSRGHWKRSEPGRELSQPHRRLGGGGECPAGMALGNYLSRHSDRFAGVTVVTMAVWPIPGFLRSGVHPHRRFLLGIGVNLDEGKPFFVNAELAGP